jgi:hypothetical protein
LSARHIANIRNIIDNEKHTIRVSVFRDAVCEARERVNDELRAFAGRGCGPRDSRKSRNNTHISPMLARSCLGRPTAPENSENISSIFGGRRKKE